MTIGRIPGANGIQPNIVDAKGDLIAATAADSVTRLAVGTNGQVLTADSAETTGLKWAAPDPLTTKGDLFTFSTTEARLPVGTNGHVLTADSAETTGLKWAAPAAGGKVLQVVSATTTTSTTVASTTLTDTTLSASITPSSTNSKILVITNQNTEINRTIFSADARVRIMRGSTAIYEQTANEGAFWIYTDGSGTTNTIGIQMITLVYLDSPNTTSSTTYKTQGAVSVTANASQVTFQSNSRPSSITLLEIGA